MSKEFRKNLEEFRRKAEELVNMADRNNFNELLKCIRGTKQKHHPRNFFLDVSDEEFEVLIKYVKGTLGTTNESDGYVTIVFQFGKNIYFGVRGICSGWAVNDKIYEVFEMKKENNIYRRIDEKK